MLTLFNSNNYIGGGETIFLRFALYLKSENLNFGLLCSKDSFLESSAIDNNIDFSSFNFISGHHGFDEFVTAIPNKSVVFVCQLKDLYNLRLASTGKGLKLKIIYLYYHPEDYQYLNIWDCFSNRCQLQNIENLNKLNLSDSLFFPSIKYYDLLGFENRGLGSCIPGFLVKPILEKRKEIISILCISRFVDFKTGGILALLRLIHQKRHLRCKIIGYGKFAFVLKFWTKMLRIEDRIEFLGMLEPHQLEDLISRADVCFAQGTSLLQCVSMGKPTIVHSYSSPFSMLFPSKMSAGIWGLDECSFGEFYSLQKYNICDCFDYIERNYSDIVKTTLTEAMSKSEKTVFDFVLDKLEDAKFVDLRQISVPEVPLLKKLYVRFRGFLNANM